MIITVPQKPLLAFQDGFLHLPYAQNQLICRSACKVPLPQELLELSPSRGYLRYQYLEKFHFANLLAYIFLKNFILV